MKKAFLTLAVLAALAQSANAVVFINEVFINPPGSYDSTREFVELLGTPGKKLDGYAIAFVNGGLTRYFPLNALPSSATNDTEIDEFFSLDGLELGENGLLVIAAGSNSSALGYFPRLLDDTNFQRWDVLWNGGLDTVGKLNNDGSVNVFLIRNRPGVTQADPTNPAGLRWGKDITHDNEIDRPVVDPSDGLEKDQYGNGAIDKGELDPLGNPTLDLRGFQTLVDTSDDLEIVDEISMESEKGWEYDLDSRNVDSNSVLPGLPARKVHALDDPQGFNPDALSRVDYRTKGAGHTPVAGATGELPNGNNWPDTATEQWVRGETMVGEDADLNPIFFFDNAANADPHAIQPYDTQVPLWLADGSGVDYDFLSAPSYEIMAGRINPLAVPFIPGDSDRDGDCDADDIAKIAAVFGDDNWIFSNSFADAPEGKGGDPSTQTRPWDVDATGDNGVEASDLQWTLNFQGDATGRIVGVQYDDPTPSAVGVTLNPHPGVTCTVTAGAQSPSGHPLSALAFGDTVIITVRGQVTGGANATPGQENGIMQFIHDLALDPAGVLRVVGIAPLGGFTHTRALIQTPQGVAGDLGVASINGYTTSFTAGLTQSVDLYEVTLMAVGSGGVEATIAPAAQVGFAASTPQGLKVGHTDNNGNPAVVSYPVSLAFSVGMMGDVDGDGDVDLDDLAGLGECMTGPQSATLAHCRGYDLDGDNDVDLMDFGRFAGLFGS